MKRKDKWTINELISEFQEHLRHTRGTDADEKSSDVRYVRAFLEQAVDIEPVDVASLSASEVISFILSLVDRYEPSSIRKASTALRSFFRFLRFAGLRDDRLDNAVPGVVKRRLVGLPCYIEGEELDHLIASLDSSTPCARRDRAIILCIARLGLRASEVVRMSLEDIDWRAAELRVPTRKTGRGALLPLPVDVGEAIVEYIQKGRPPTPSRHVFVLHHLRVGEPTTQSTMYDAVKTALDRAGIESTVRGPNLLRHTLATSLIRSGASLKEIADLFGHRNLETTQIYAKLDVESLREVAQPWPGEVLS